MASQVASLVVPQVLPVQRPSAPAAVAADVVGVNLPDITVPVALVLLYLWLRK